MTKTNDFIKNYWNYYLSLESDLLSTKRFLEIDEINSRSYSIEYIKQYQNICSEIDVVLKQYCKELDVAFKGEKINHYCECINNNKNSILNEQVLFNKSTILVPWKDWTAEVKFTKDNKKIIESNNPIWWRIYGKIKHNRTTINKELSIPYYKLANQENVYNALAGLFVIEMNYYKTLALKEGYDDCFPEIESRIFEMKNWTRKYIRPAKPQYEVLEDM